MSGDQTRRIIGWLDAALSETLTVITQLFLHAAILQARKHPLATTCYEQWAATMRRSDRLLEGILALGGQPSSRPATRLELGRTPRHIVGLDVALLERWLECLDTALANCTSAEADETASMLSELRDAERVALEQRRAWRDQLADCEEQSPAFSSIRGAPDEALHSVLRNELSAITQAYYHGQLCAAWGADTYAEFLANETWEKTWRSVELTERLLAAGIYPPADGHGELHIGRNLAEALERDRDLVAAQLATVDTALESCDPARHPRIHDTLVRTRAGEQAHADWIAAQIVHLNPCKPTSTSGER